MPRRKRMLRHLPPTAVRVEGGDLWHGLTALWRPQAAMAEFRNAVVERTGCPVCHPVGAARAALTVILIGLKRLAARSRVIVPAYTCPTVVQATLKAGLEPVFCDVSPQTLDLDRGALSRLIDQGPDRILAIVQAHLYGLAQDVRDLLAVGRRYGIFVVEDAAQAFGALFRGRMVGTWGDAGVYSLGRGKCIPAGHGGVIVSQERCAAAIAEAMQETISGQTGQALAPLVMFAGYGAATHPTGWWLVARTKLNPADEGMDVNALPPVQLHGLAPVYAALGAAILRRLAEIQDTGRQNARWMISRLAELDFAGLPYIPPEAEPVFLRLPIILDSEERADRLYDLLWQEGIGISRSYRRSLPDLFSDLLHTDERDFPGASRLARCLLTLPTHAYLKEEDMARITDAFQAAAVWAAQPVS